MIKAIIFDWGGVITQNGKLVPFAKKYSRKYGKDSEEFHSEMRKIWEKAKIGKKESKLFWKNIAKYLGISQEIFEQDLKNFFGFREKIIPLLYKLKEKYQLAILSNQIKDWFESETQKQGLKKIFNKIIVSYEVGFSKPDPRIFKKTLQILGLKPEECIFVDDSEKNIPFPKKLGFKTIHFKNIKQLKKELRKLGVKIC